MHSFSLLNVHMQSFICILIPFHVHHRPLLLTVVCCALSGEMVNPGEVVQGELVLYDGGCETGVIETGCNSG